MTSNGVTTVALITTYIPRPIRIALQNLRLPELGWGLWMGVGGGGGSGDVGSGGWYAGGASSSGSGTDIDRKDRFEEGELGCCCWSVMIIVPLGRGVKLVVPEQLRISLPDCAPPAC